METSMLPALAPPNKKLTSIFFCNIAFADMFTEQSGFAGPSEQALTPNRRHSVAAVLESAGWGATSPDKRVTPPQKAAQAASRHLADYEAMLPAQPQPARAVSLASPG